MPRCAASLAAPLTCALTGGAQVITFKDTAKSRGFGFVTFATPEAAANAVTQLHGATVGGRALSVAISEPREPRFPRALPGSDAGARSSGLAQHCSVLLLTV
jgi:RNA recognition motif-containing protein